MVVVLQQSVHGGQTLLQRTDRGRGPPANTGTSAVPFPSRSTQCHDDSGQDFVYQVRSTLLLSIRRPLPRLVVHATISDSESVAKRTNRGFQRGTSEASFHTDKVQPRPLSTLLPRDLERGLSSAPAAGIPGRDTFCVIIGR
jgi:hypothetical protein